MKDNVYYYKQKNRNLFFKCKKVLKKMLKYLDDYEKYNLVNLFLLYGSDSFIVFLKKLKKV